MGLLSKKQPALEESQRVALEEGRHQDPHTVLGAHQAGKQVVFRARRPFAETVTAVLDSGDQIPLGHVGNGIWEGRVKLAAVPDYRVRATYRSDDGATNEWLADDPYRFAPTVGELDLYLFAHGEHERLWEVLGCRLITHRGIERETAGAAFTVWAPNAQAVRVVGDFNRWDGAGHALRRLGPSGVWELFVPEVGEGSAYKFEILDSLGVWHQKADPMARFTEPPSRTASKTGCAKTRALVPLSTIAFEPRGSLAATGATAIAG